MNVRVENAGPCRKKLLIEVPAEKVQAEYEAMVAAFARSARIRGFRPGKAPADLVRRRFDKDIKEELQSHLISQAYHEALAQERLDPLAVLGIDRPAVVCGQPLVFSVTVDVPPEFQLPEYKGIPIQVQPIQVSDQDVDAALVELRERHARYETVTDRPVRQGDLVQVDFEGVCEGRPLAELTPKAAAFAQGKEFWVPADRETFVPGFGEALVGAMIGEKKQIQVDFSPAFAEVGLAGRKAVYFTDIKAIREKRLPEMDADFLKEFQVESLDQLRAQVRENLTQMRKIIERRRQMGEIEKYLLGSVSMDLPESVVQEETQKAIYHIVRQNTQRGIAREAIESQKAQIFEAATRDAREMVKLRYILHRIAQVEQITAASDAVDREINRLAERYGVTPEQLRQDLEERKSMEAIEEDVRIKLALEFLLEQAALKT